MQSAINLTNYNYYGREYLNNIPIKINKINIIQLFGNSLYIERIFISLIVFKIAMVVILN